MRDAATSPSGASPTGGRCRAASADGRRHTPSLWNVAYNRWFFWDGRADSLWSQALQPDRETRWRWRAAATAVVRGRARRRAPARGVRGRSSAPLPAAGAHRAAVNRVFVNLGKALEAYERAPRQPPRALRRVRRGRCASGTPREQAALSEPAARRGLKLFVGRGNCRTCHTGPTFTDGEFHDIGAAAGTGVSTRGGSRASTRAA